MTTHEWKGEALTTSSGTTTHLNPVVIQSPSGIPLEVAGTSGARGIRIYEAATTIWNFLTLGTVTSFDVFCGWNPGADLGSSNVLGTSSKRWSSLWVGTKNVKTHPNFAGSQQTTATGALQTTSAVTGTVYTSPAVLDNSATSVQVTAIGRDTAGTNRGMAMRRALLTRHAGGTTALVGVVDAAYTNMPAGWGGGVALTQCTITPAGTSFVVHVQGAAGTTINWAVTVTVQTVSGST